MPNIMVTQLCNLSCPYCFANEFVNKTVKEISIDNFQKALSFALSSRSFGGEVGIIGGEPTLHSKFPELLSILNQTEHCKEVLIFTNGIRIDETFNITLDDKFYFLINLNSPETIGDKKFSRIVKNISTLASVNAKRNSITLGINIYKHDMNYDFFINTLQEYKIKNARLSITIPNCTTKNKKSGLSKLLSFKNEVFKLYVELLYQGINVIFDCNKIPPCLWTNDELKKISLFQANRINERIGINLESSKCKPVIDILPDLTAIRCFGLSDCSKVKIEDFNCIDGLYKYYRKNFDEKLITIPTTYECKNCELFVNHSCSGGCLTYKW